MAIIIGNSTAFAPVDEERYKEMIMARNAIHDVIREWCKTRGWPLESSVHAPSDEEDVFLDEPDNKDVNDPYLVKALSEAEQGTQVPATGSGSGSGPNPEAAPFVPSRQAVFRGVRSPEEFMAQVHAMQPQNPVRTATPDRRILFRNLPSWATISDVLCLVHGGAVNRVWNETENEIMVQFCDETACKQYYETYSQGIRLEGDHVIAIEKPRGSDRLTTSLKDKIEAGVSRLVLVANIPNEKTFQDLRGLVKDYSVDHILWRAEVDRPGMAYIFFGSLTNAWEFKRQIEADYAWENCDVEYLPDPCQVAPSFHENTIPSRMSSAVANNV